MDSYITLNKMRFFAHHGVAQQERTVGNWFEVTLTVKANMQQAIEHDMLSGTIDYSEIYSIVEHEMLIPSQLIEHVAGRIIKALLAQTAITAGTITVEKLSPPFKCQLQSVAVTINF
ncbi:MAG: dihydroneopterin aldolase [Muribaculaceae bacterium]